MQAHLGTDSLHRPGQEMCCTHPGLERAERVLDRLPPDSHNVRRMIQSCLHRIQVASCSQRAPSTFTGCALSLYGA